MGASKGKVSMDEEAQLVSRLSSRERDILRLLANGYSNVEIAEALNLKETTTEKYLYLLGLKLQIHKRASQAIFAVRSGLCKLEELELR